MATEKTSSAETVTVGCKLPHGIHLDLYNTNGATPEERAMVTDRVTLNGLNSSDIVGGHGITFGVPKAHFDEWMRLHKNSAAVKNELIFAHTQAKDTVAQAEANKDNKSGFEGLDPNKPGPGVERAKENDINK